MNAELLFGFIGYGLDTSRTDNYILVYIKVDRHFCGSKDKVYKTVERNFIIFNTINNTINTYTEILDSRNKDIKTRQALPINENMLKAINQQIKELKQCSNDVQTYLETLPCIPVMADDFDTF